MTTWVDGLETQRNDRKEPIIAAANDPTIISSRIVDVLTFPQFRKLFEQRHPHLLYSPSLLPAPRLQDMIFGIASEITTEDIVQRISQKTSSIILPADVDIHDSKLKTRIHDYIAPFLWTHAFKESPILGGEQIRGYDSERLLNQLVFVEKPVLKVRPLGDSAKGLRRWTITLKTQKRKRTLEITPKTNDEMNYGWGFQVYQPVKDPPGLTFQRGVKEFLEFKGSVTYPSEVMAGIRQLALRLIPELRN
jgi:hypothetical protein